MEYIAGLLGIVIVLLFMISLKVDDIAQRMKDQFPTQREVEREP
jgi:hypothetical protein